MTDFSEITRTAAALEVMRRSEVEERLLRLAFEGGVGTLTIAWPNDYFERGVHYDLAAMREILKINPNADFIAKAFVSEGPVYSEAVTVKSCPPAQSSTDS